MFRLRILTPEGIYYDNDVSSINIKSIDGRRTLLPNHMPLVMPTDLGVLEIRDGQKENRYFAFDGILTFKKNVANLMVTVIEREDKIDFVRAEKARQRALNRIENKQDSVDLIRAEAALRRAIERLRLEE